MILPPLPCPSNPSFIYFLSLYFYDSSLTSLPCLYHQQSGPFVLLSLLCESPVLVKSNIHICIAVAKCGRTKTQNYVDWSHYKFMKLISTSDFLPGEAICFTTSLHLLFLQTSTLPARITLLLLSVKIEAIRRELHKLP